MEHHNTASFSPLEHKSTTNSRISPPPPPPTRHLKRPQSSLLEIPSCCRLIWALHAATLGWEALARPQSQALGRGDTRPCISLGTALPSLPAGCTRQSWTRLSWEGGKCGSRHRVSASFHGLLLAQAKQREKGPRSHPAAQREAAAPVTLEPRWPFWNTLTPSKQVPIATHARTQSGLLGAKGSSKSHRGKRKEAAAADVLLPFLTTRFLAPITAGYLRKKKMANPLKRSCGHSKQGKSQGFYLNKKEIVQIATDSVKVGFCEEQDEHEVRPSASGGGK